MPDKWRCERPAEEMGYEAASRGGQPLGRRLLELYRRTRDALVVGLLLCCAGPAPPADAAIVIREFPIPGHRTGPGITTGPDGALWYTEFFRSSKIGRMTTLGVPSSTSPRRTAVQSASPSTRRALCGSPSSMTTGSSGSPRHLGSLLSRPNFQRSRGGE